MAVEMVEMSQEQAARLPFKSKYPTSKLIAWMLGQAGLLKPFKPLHVIDATFGQGVFWHALRGKVILAAVDTRRLEWVARPRCFIQAPAQKWREWLPEALRCLGGRVHVVAVDPPWQQCVKGNGCRGRELGGRYHYRASQAWGRPEEILAAGLELARELGAPVLYHWHSPLEYRHIVGPVSFRPFFHVLNPRASDYRSYFGIVRG